MTKGVSMIETLRDFVRRADEIGIEYMVTGSFAMSAYGEIRFTRDIDIVIQLASAQVDKFTQNFIDDYYVSKDAIKMAISRRSMFNMISQEHGGKLDCILIKDSDFARTSFERRYKVQVSDLEFWATTKDDLIVAKLIWARDTHSALQIRDIANMTRSEYDSAYVLNWIERMNLQSIWSEVEKWKTQQNGDDNKFTTS